MKRSVLALAAALALPVVPAVSHADVAFNVGAVTDYRYRGISQTRLKPALQGGVDYTNGPFYLGLWATNIKWIKDAGGDASVEVDLYGGYAGDLGGGLGYDVGVLAYQYPSNKLNPSANTTELYGAVSYGPLKVKYSHAVTDTFGFGNSKNSYYLEAGATFDVGGFGVTPHVGYQKFKNNDTFSYTDYSLTVSKDVGGGLVVSLAVVGTDADKALYTVQGKEIGKAGLVLGAKYSF